MFLWRQVLDRSWLGWAELEPAEDAVAGSYSTWRLTIHVGRYGIDDGGSIRVARRSVSDEEDPQFKDPAKPGYTTVTASRDVRLEKFFSNRGHIRPFRAALQVDVRDGSLYEGDTLTIVYGDRGRGSPGIRNQSFREEEHMFQVLVDPFGSGLFEEITGSPSIRIVGGPAASIEVAAPSEAVVGEPFTVVARALDSFGNRCDGYRGEVTITAEDKPLKPYNFTDEDLGAHRFTLALRRPGLQRLTVSDGGGFCAESNPIMVEKQRSEHRLLWGDMHGQTKETVGTGTLDEYFSFLRDVAAMDFGGWQGNDFQVTLNDEGMPSLRISPYYKQLMAQPDGTGDAKGYIQEKMRSAVWLIRSIHQRQRTLYKVTCSIVKFQSDFLERGVSDLKPMVLRDVADDIGMRC